VITTPSQSLLLLLLLLLAGVHAHAAAQVLRQLEPLQQQLAGLAAGSLEGDWEGALELVGHIGDALRQVGIE
jgi:hypothetical protein